ncbi:MAG: LysR family transcriptional regulator [Rhodothermales bacterium]
MEFYQLRSFVVVAEESSITQAAKRLYTTPPSVSAHIKALEEELGICLFERLPSGMKLTPKGDIIRKKAEATLRAAQDVVNYATEIQSHLMGVLRIGINAPAHFLRIPELVIRMQENHPGIELNVINSSSGQILSALKSKELDAGYLFGPVIDSQITAHFLCTTELVVAAPPEWEEAVEKADWKKLATLPWIDTDYEDCPFQLKVEDIFRSKGLSYVKAARSADETTRRDLVAAGAGLSLLLKQEAEGNESKPVKIVATESFDCPLHIAYLANQTTNPLIGKLIEVIRTSDIATS